MELSTVSNAQYAAVINSSSWPNALHCPIFTSGIICAMSTVSKALYAALYTCTFCESQGYVLPDASDANNALVESGVCFQTLHCAACGLPQHMEPDLGGHVLVPFQQLWIRDSSSSGPLSRPLLVHAVAEHAGMFSLGDHVVIFGHAGAIIRRHRSVRLNCRGGE